MSEAADLVRNGLRPRVDDVIPGILEGANLTVRPVDATWYEGLFG